MKTVISQQGRPSEATATVAFSINRTFDLLHHRSMIDLGNEYSTIWTFVPWVATKNVPELWNDQHHHLPAIWGPGSEKQWTTATVRHYFVVNLGMVAMTETFEAATRLLLLQEVHPLGVIEMNCHKLDRLCGSCIDLISKAATPEGSTRMVQIWDPSHDSKAIVAHF
jgi:hypothetical protein